MLLGVPQVALTERVVTSYCDADARSCEQPDAAGRGRHVATEVRGRNVSDVRLIYSGRTVALSRQAASAVADELWKGSRPGSVTSAVKLAQALASRGQAYRQLIEFDDYEASAIDRA